MSVAVFLVYGLPTTLDGCKSSQLPASSKIAVNGCHKVVLFWILTGTPAIVVSKVPLNIPWAYTCLSDGSYAICSPNASPAVLALGPKSWTITILPFGSILAIKKLRLDLSLAFVLDIAPCKPGWFPKVASPIYHPVVYATLPGPAAIPVIWSSEVPPMPFT